ncbi:MAG: glycoside hydrolase family 127 protein [Eubacterium sp.]|nr:glycoside hydrolase family 127 protein [Eubacterium sp.]
MLKKIPIYFEKYACFKRKAEPCNIAFPIEKGKLFVPEKIVIRDEEGKAQPTQSISTALWNDSRIKWAYADFLCDLPENKDITYYICFDGKEEGENLPYTIDGKTLSFTSGGESFSFGEETDFYLNGVKGTLTGNWKAVRSGGVTCIFKNCGSFDKIDFELTIQMYRGCPWVKADIRLINRADDDFIYIKTLSYKTENTGENRFAIGTSNYLTKYIEGDDIAKRIDSEYLMYDANEHLPETFYGTFFGDMSAENRGIAVTLYQAYQNFPAEIKINKSGMETFILSAENEPVKLFRGMAKTSTIFIHKHSGLSKEEVNLRSLMFQMPDKGVIPSEVFEKSGVFPKIFVKDEDKQRQAETALVSKLDSRGRAYGFIHWGDNVDFHYTRQGRGMGRNVWCNNEYDFGHAALLYYARTGLRRALDSMLVSVRHQIDVDIVHCSDDPLRLDGQVTHSADHVSGKVEISHEWAEGILDYYHFTADKSALETALKMGDNIIRHLKEPRYQKKGGVNARETGWALRSLCALYEETGDEKWLEPCSKIAEHFFAWKEEYGGWLAPYTDNTVIRVPFMISIAIISLMRYYIICKDEKIKDMMVDAADDLVENAYLDSGYFYYKELPSLKRTAGNTTLLEAMVIAYELTGKASYLKYGFETFKGAVGNGSYTPLSFGKKVDEDAIIISGNSSKGVGQSFIPLMKFYSACCEAGFIKELFKN